MAGCFFVIHFAGPISVLFDGTHRHLLQRHKEMQRTYSPRSHSQYVHIAQFPVRILDINAKPFISDKQSVYSRYLNRGWDIISVKECETKRKVTTHRGKKSMLHVNNNSYLGFWEPEIVQEKFLQFFERNTDCMIVPGQERLKDTSVLPWWRNTRRVKEKSGAWRKKQIRLSRARSKVCQDPTVEEIRGKCKTGVVHLLWGGKKKTTKNTNR